VKDAASAFCRRGAIWSRRRGAIARSFARAAAAWLVCAPGVAHAFSHVVKPGETLAQIAERVYGSAKLETVLVGANALDVEGGTVIVPGMRLEVPSPGHHTVLKGQTWAEIALAWLGSSDVNRAAVIARNNKSEPWLLPVEGQEIEIPAVLTYIAGDGETVNSIAARFWGDPNRGWELNPYNVRDGVTVKRGEVVLVPLPHLKLTDAGKTEARAAAERDGAIAGLVLEQQRRADAELPQLMADVRHGHYAEAIALGNRILTGAALTHPQLAAVHRNLLEAYVAVDARTAAAASCATWRANDPAAVLDPVRLSPKIIAVCQ
jgi:LysM repeat protein